MILHMKFRTRFLTLLAVAAAALTGCKQEEADYDLPSIKIGGQFDVDKETKKASVEAGKDLTVLNLAVTATRDWVAEIEWDEGEVPWIAVTPEVGPASDSPQSVKVTILENAGYNRSKQIKFSINYDYKSLSITQAGEKGEEVVGTLDNPFTVAGVNKYVRNLGADIPSPTPVYVKGKISQITGNYTESGTYGNATFYISDDGSTNNEFYAYRLLYLGNKKFTAGQTDIKVGDEVIVCGNVVNYKGNTPETVQGTAFLYELNGVSDGGEPTPPGPGGDPAGTGTQADPYNVAAALDAVKDFTWTSNTEYDKTGTVYVKGKISRIVDNGTFGQSGTFGNASFYMSDDGSASNEFYAYRILYLGNKKYTSGTDIKVGDEVIVCGELMNYRGNTPETVANSAYLYSLNGKTDGGDTPPGPSDAKAVTVAEFNAAPESDTQVYELVGTIGGSINTTYGNFDLTDETGTVYVYGLTATNLGYGAKNDKSYESLGLAEGDKIKIRGYRGSFGDKIEVMYAWFIEKVGGDTPPTPSEVKAVTIAEFNAAAESDSQVYELVGTIGGSINTTYGNFDLTDATGTVYVYGLTATNLGYGAKNDKSYATLGLAEGDKIKIRGYRGSFGDKIEVMYAWFIEKVGGDTPPGPGGASGSGTQADPYNPLGAIDAVKDLTWTSNTEYESTGEVYVKGKISRIASGGTFTEGGTYGNASFYISEDGTENNEFYCFRILYLGNKKFESGQTDIKVGDEVVVYGKLMNYRGNTPETVAGKAYLHSLNGKTDGGDTPPTPSEVKAVTIAEFNAAAESDSQVYELVGTIEGSINTTYGNFDLTDATGTVYVYGLTATELGYGAKNDKSYATLGLVEGDKIKIRGYRGSFGDKIEVMYAWFIEKVSGGGTPSGGTLDNPYTVAQALDAVKDLTWTSNTEYESTDEVYMKGKISRIASGGTFTEGGTYGNASFYISDDGTENNEFYCFRILYLGNKKFESGQTDIKVGDEVVICGKLMNYRGNTPETVSGKAYLYSLNGSSSGGGGGDTPGGSSVSFDTNESAQTWAAGTDGTYGTGFATTTQGLKIGYYKHTSTATLQAPNANHVRVYKNSVLSIASAEGKKIKKIVIGCAPDAGSSSYCYDMAGLEGGASATADKASLTVTWSGSASKVVLHANNGQVRMEKLTVEFE